MGAGKSVGSGWQDVPVTLRSDIVAAAEKEKLDISSECNKALAQRLGIECQTSRQAPVNSKVIVAPDNVPVKRSVQTPAAPPVINAEDPTVPGKVLREKKERKPPAVTKPREDEQPRTAHSPVKRYLLPLPQNPKRRVKKRRQLNGL